MASNKHNLKFVINVIVLPSLTKCLPPTSFQYPNCPELSKLELADPNFNKSAQIDIILGNDSERYINLEGIKNNICGTIYTLYIRMGSEWTHESRSYSNLHHERRSLRRYRFECSSPKILDTRRYSVRKANSSRVPVVRRVLQKNYHKESGRSVCRSVTL